jgi:hypothetical protein
MNNNIDLTLFGFHLNQIMENISIVCGAILSSNGLIFNRVNTYGASSPQAPFGGFKMSGQGRKKLVMIGLLGQLC